MEVYQVRRRNTEGPADWLMRGDALALLEKRLAGKGPYRVKLMEDGAEWDESAGLDRTLAKVERLMVKGDPGDAIWVDTKTRAIFMVRIGTFHLDPSPVCPTPHTESIAKAWDFVHKETQRVSLGLGRKLRVVSMGIFNCRHIAGSLSWSQHAWSNGLDFVVRNSTGHNDIEAMDHIVAACREEPYIAQVLWRGVPNHYPGHAHLSGEPMRSGTPPCAFA